MEFHNSLSEQFCLDIEKELETGTLNFPTSFELINRISNTLNDENLSIKELARLVQTEPLLYAKLLKTVNSFLMSGDRVITSSLAAIQKLGIAKTKCIVYTITLEQIFCDYRTREVKQIANIIWKHTLDIAAWCYVLAKDNGKIDTSVALLTGMMVDIGQFFMVSRISNYPGLDIRSDMFYSIIKEKHDDIRKHILDSLKIPTMIIDAFDQYHTHPKRPPESLSDILTLAGLISERANPLLILPEKCRRIVFNEELSDEEADFLEQYKTRLIDEKNLVFNNLIK